MTPTDHTTPVRVAAATPGRPSRAVRWTVTAAVASLCATGLVVTSGAPAGAAPAKPKPRDPIASAPKFVAAPGGLTITGWAVDPDAPTTNVRVGAVLDGKKTIGLVTTSLPKASVVKKYRSGPTPAYSLTVPVPAGKHVVCAVIGNVGGGLPVVKRCVATPLGRTLTTTQKAKRSPKGAVLTATTSSTALRVAGWASDPDFLNRRSRVTLYVDGRAAKTVTTKRGTGTPPAGAGKAARFDVSLPASAATHIVCLWVSNVGFGSNTFLGCKALDTRARGAASASPTPPATPALNSKVVTLAKKQIGKPYVWGATGPRSFDCSGIVMWAYGKYGYSTPRVSQDQIKAARLIPASRAVPGDLVFYHDTVGDVYHVGIYLKPGLSVAAISTDQGVDYQRIWDTTATYGSFTHT